jgi:transcriptional regulator with XRE-family HTH domain
MKKTPQEASQKTPQEAPPDAVPTAIRTPQGATLPAQSLQAWRVARGLSQQRLAERARAQSGSTTLEEDTVRNIEKARTRPALDTALALAQALEVLVEQVLWPTAEEVRANGSSRRSRYEKQQQELRAPRIPTHGAPDAR